MAQIIIGGNAQAGDVKSGKTFSAGIIYEGAGTMPNEGGVTITPTNIDQAIPAGYHDGTGKVPAVAVDPTKVLTGTTIAGTAGSMPNHSGSWQSGTFIQNDPTYGTLIKPPAGYYDGGTNSYVAAKDANLVAANIANLTSIFGITGTLKRNAKGNFTLPGSQSSYTVSGLAFIPSLIIVFSQTGSNSAPNVDVSGYQTSYDGTSYKSWNQSWLNWSNKILPASPPTTNSFVINQAFATQYTMYATWFAFE